MTDDIKLPPLPLERAALESGVKVYAEYTLRQYARDAIEADRLKREDFINDDRDSLRAEIVALKGTISDMEFDRQQRGEPVKVPSDEELYDLAESMGAVIVCNGEGDYNDNVDSIVSYARTLLARYGTTVSCQIYGHPLQACSE